MAEKNIEIVYIIFKMGKQEVKVSVEEAKKLYGLLNEMFAQKILTVSQPYPVPQPFLPTYPWYWRYQDTFTYTCDAGTANYCADTNALTLDISNGNT